jgi:hypothetical protein
VENVVVLDHLPLDTTRARSPLLVGKQKLGDGAARIGRVRSMGELGRCLINPALHALIHQVPSRSILRTSPVMTSAQVALYGVALRDT